MDIKFENWQSTWNIIKNNLKNYTTAASYEIFLQPVNLYCVDEMVKIFFLQVPDNMSNMDVIKDRFTNMIREKISEVTGENYEITIKHESDYKKEDTNTSFSFGEKNNFKEKTLDNTFSPIFYDQKIFIPEYTFDNFVVGESNIFPYTQALSIAKSEETNFNCMYLYGDSGLGKTHLMNAIGLYILENNPRKNVLYVTSETFTNECIMAIRQNSMDDFRKKYRNVDVLLIDDIQFLENKNKSEEEFFHTFNELFKMNKKIIISSDRPPLNLTKIDRRLKSRFSWHIIADIAPPDYETRVAILEKKCENKNIKITDDLRSIIYFIAEKKKDNIRELEGILNTIISFSAIYENLTLEKAKNILKNFLKEEEVNLTPEYIKKTVAKHFSISLEDLDSTKKNNQIAIPRQIAMYLCRNLTDLSLPKIGQYFGNKHHTTVKHAVEKIEKKIKTDIMMKQDIESIKEKLS